MDKIKNVRNDDDFLQGEIYSTFAEDYLEFYAEKGISLEYVTACMDYFDNLPGNVLDWLYKASILYCQDTDRKWGDPVKEFKNPEDILEEIWCMTLKVPEPKHGNLPLAYIGLDCTWDPEHGLEWLIRRDEVLYVGGFGPDFDPWADLSQLKLGNFANLDTSE